MKTSKQRKLEQNKKPVIPANDVYFRNCLKCGARFKTYSPFLRSHPGCRR